MNKNQRGFGIVEIIILVIVITGIIGLSWYVWQAQQKKTETPTQTESNSLVDTSDTKTLRISEFVISINYDKSLPDMEYSIKNSDQSTEYAELTNSELVGDRCVDDIGSIAQIVKNASDTENQTHFVSKATIGSDVYHLALTGSNCTGNTDLLTKYQNSLKANFANLKAE